MNCAERMRVLHLLKSQPPAKRLFAENMHWTGARPSETLSIVPAACQIDASVIAIQTLKRRGWKVREVPVPRDHMNQLDKFFDIRRKQRTGEDLYQPLWPFSRVTAWRLFKSVMAQAEIRGARACPRGMRHGFGVGNTLAGVPLNQTQIWMGHANIASTAIYAEACGPEQIELAARFWNFSDERSNVC